MDMSIYIDISIYIHIYIYIYIYIYMEHWLTMSSYFRIGKKKAMLSSSKTKANQHLNKNQLKHVLRISTPRMPPGHLTYTL